MQPSFNPTDKLDEKVKSYVLDYAHFPCGIAVIQNDASSTLLRANPAFYDMIGHTEEEFMANHANHMADIALDDYYDALGEKHDKTNDYDFNWDVRLRAADGSIRWVHDVVHYDAELNVYFALFVDITNKMATASTELSYNAFQAKNEILLYLSQYTTKHLIVSDAETEQVIYMSASAMKLSGFTQESDWQGKTYREVVFGNGRHIPQSYYTPLREDVFTERTYYNEYHKKFTRTESKLITIPALHRKMRLDIINDITAEKHLEHRMNFRTALYHCIETLFTSGAKRAESTRAYFDILAQLKTFYHAKEAFFYKFADQSNTVEALYRVRPDGTEDTKHDCDLTANEAQLNLLQAISEASVSQQKQVIEMYGVPYQDALKQLQVEYEVQGFSCVAVNDAQGDLVAFMGVTNPAYHEEDKELLHVLSRFICMFIEHEQDELYKEEALALEAISKKALVEESMRNCQDLAHPSESIARTLDALCHHYEADFAVVISRDEKGGFDMTHTSSGEMPDLRPLRQASHMMGGWLGTFHRHAHFASDLDFDDAKSPLIKKLLLDKFGIHNFVASPMRDPSGAFKGLLIVNNFKLTNRSHLMVHVITKDIADYLDRIKMQEALQLEPTTRLVNKTATECRISQLLEKEARGTLFIIDIDNFKNLNDTLGHQMGDTAILDIAGILKQSFRSTDIIGRVGGDEFMVFSPGLTTTDMISSKVTLLLEKCQLSYTNNNISTEVSISVGICSVADSYKTFEALYAKTDYALYVSKRSGKNQYHIYTPSEQDLAQAYERPAHTSKKKEPWWKRIITR